MVTVCEVMKTEARSVTTSQVVGPVRHLIIDEQIAPDLGRVVS